MTDAQFKEKLKEMLKDNMSLSLSVGSSYGYGEDTKVLTIKLLFNGEPLCYEEISLE